MKGYSLILVAFIGFAEAIGQNQQANLEKYWAYRQRLREKFIVVSSNVEHFGVNIPASARNVTLYKASTTGIQHQVDLSEYPAGIYLLKIQHKSEIIHRKIMRVE